MWTIRGVQGLSKAVSKPRDSPLTNSPVGQLSLIAFAAFKINLKLS